jgi:hypothetical protein
MFDLGTSYTIGRYDTYINTYMIYVHTILYTYTYLTALYLTYSNIVCCN